MPKKTITVLSPHQLKAQFKIAISKDESNENILKAALKAWSVITGLNFYDMDVADMPDTSQTKKGLLFSVSILHPLTDRDGITLQWEINDE